MPGARSPTLKAPVGGWDARESIADMPADRALFMDNWFPETDKVTVRRGSASHATGLSGATETLIEYVPATGAGELFAANGGEIYDVSAAGAIGAGVTGGSHTNDRWQFVNLSTTAGHYVRLFNGADTPQLYDGTTWNETAVAKDAGDAETLTAANLIWANVHQNRMWFGEGDSMLAWYMPVKTISGAVAKSFPLGSIFRRGGYVMAMATWTRDSGSGSDDVAVFVTSEGECALYVGVDPDAAETWELVGVFRIGRPIGRRCFVQAGADLILITEDGFVPLSAILTLDRSQAAKAALSEQIRQAVNEVVRSYKAVFGWQPIIYPRGQQLIFNVPITTTLSHQYVFNTLTGAPCRFTGMNAVCFGMIDDKMYFGGADGRVYQWDEGADDNPAGVSTIISADCAQAFNYFRSSSRKKNFKLVEPILESNGVPKVAVAMNIDFKIGSTIGNPAAASGAAAATWGVSKWGVGLWGSSSQIYDGWRGVRGSGRAASVRLKIETDTVRTSWLATNFSFIPGGQL